MISNESRGGWPATIIQYLAWAITSIGAIFDVLFVREAILALLAVFKVLSTEAYHRRGGLGEDIFTNFGITAFDNVMILLLGLGAIAFTIWVEYRLRRARPKGQLYPVIGKIVLIEVAIFAGSILVRFLVSTFFFQG